MLNDVKCPQRKSVIKVDNSKSHTKHIPVKVAKKSHAPFIAASVMLASVAMLLMIVVGPIFFERNTNIDYRDKQYLSIAKDEIKTSVKAASARRYGDSLKTTFATVAYAGESNDVPSSTPIPTNTSIPTATPTAVPSTSPTPTPVPKNRITQITIKSDGGFETTLGSPSIHGIAKVKKTDPNINSVTDLVFISENPKVATVKNFSQKSNTEQEFVIEAVSAGETYIYAKTREGYISSNRVKVKVNEPVEAESISLDYEEYTIYVGDYFFLRADISPEDTTIKKAKWTSSDSSVVFVSSSGTIRGLRVGEAEITATTTNGLTAVCYVTVEEKPEAVEDDDENYEDEDYDEEYYEEDDYEEEYEVYVWLSATGSKYHNKPDCGRMNPNKAYQVTLSEAESQGYGPCSKCFH